jgi:hypothetical protein
MDNFKKAASHLQRDMHDRERLQSLLKESTASRFDLEVRSARCLETRCPFEQSSRRCRLRGCYVKIKG